MLRSLIKWHFFHTHGCLTQSKLSNSRNYAKLIKHPTISELHWWKKIKNKNQGSKIIVAQSDTPLQDGWLNWGGEGHFGIWRKMSQPMNFLFVRLCARPTNKEAAKCRVARRKVKAFQCKRPRHEENSHWKVDFASCWMAGYKNRQIIAMFSLQCW